MTDISAKEAERLNHLALGSLLGFAQDWQRDLVALLRSDAPIDWAVRNLLADAIEGQNFAGISMQMAGHQAQSKRLEGIYARRAWLAEGRAFASIIEASPSVELGAVAAAEATGKGDESYCRKRYYYAKNYAKWREGCPSHIYDPFPEGFLEDMWHLAAFDQKRDIKPSMDPAETFAARMGHQLAVLQQMARPDWPPETRKLFVETMILYALVAAPDRG